MHNFTSVILTRVSENFPKINCLPCVIKNTPGRNVNFWLCVFRLTKCLTQAEGPWLWNCERPFPFRNILPHTEAYVIKLQTSYTSFVKNIRLLTYLLTYSMVQSPSWEANWFAASQEIPRISQNPKVPYSTHKCPPPVSILGQPNPVHIPTSHLLEILSNIIHPSTSRSPQWFFPSGFPTKTLYTPSPHPYAPHAQPISFFSILSVTITPISSFRYTLWCEQKGN